MVHIFVSIWDNIFGNLQRINYEIFKAKFIYLRRRDYHIICNVFESLYRSCFEQIVGQRVSHSLSALKPEIELGGGAY